MLCALTVRQLKPGSSDLREGVGANGFYDVVEDLSAARARAA